MWKGALIVVSAVILSGCVIHTAPCDCSRVQQRCSTTQMMVPQYYCPFHRNAAPNCKYCEEALQLRGKQ